MNCSICEYEFNISSRLPIIMNMCCIDIICIQCCKKAADDNKIIINCPSCN